ncbi:hypothetical protein E2562_010778 [Oryza meyeriana var. granulata]|uniref:Uncharacterized protein n=1 Tax=Oryza meyeriana var. granulata TaxID=110450 RepID=A0A6G1BJG3_9ORYZ|nr:hypothetical protein E2562_010778 [Oryza meyeriana var. granulata]
MAPLCSVCAAGSNPIGCLEVEPGSGSAAPALPPLLGLIASPAVDAVPSEQRVHDIVLKQVLAAAVPLTPLGPVRLAERKHVVSGLKVAFDHCDWDVNVLFSDSETNKFCQLAYDPLVLH